MKSNQLLSVMILFIIILLVLSACESQESKEYYSSLEAALNAVESDWTHEILIDRPKEEIAVSLSKHDDNEQADRVLIIPYEIKNDKYKREEGNGEVSMALGKAEPPVRVQEFTHVDTGDKYLNGKVNSPENIKEVIVKLTNNNSVKNYNASLEGDVFLIPIGDSYSNAANIEYELIDENGKVIDVH
ncbi:hypothetical protein [Aquibacillus sediminis]|uniref:hypothetical protein n=1 Tax=Aquibacillus sediminis TaxID=2574734 RepID=UPI001108DF3C|nr:hypothetical protein [Aquibacillus sediminis]